MVVLNYTGGEINAKIVYYGPGLSGKTTNLEFIHEKTPEGARGKMVSMKTQTDRTLFFDFLPLELGEINGFRTRFLLYTVPGQVYYNATRKLVLKGADAVVFVADSSRAKLDENLESLRNLEQNLNEHGMSLDTLPWVIQYNKRDSADAMTLRDLDARLNPLRVQSFEAVATTGTGVYETFRGIASLMYSSLKQRLESGELGDGDAVAEEAPIPVAVIAQPAARPAPAASAPAAPVAAQPARPVAPPLRPAAPAPAPAAMHEEFEVDDAVDLMLREFDSAPRATRAPESSAPTGGPRASTPAPTQSAPRLAPTPSPRMETPSVGMGAHAVDATSASDDGLFESIPATSFDVELGRLPELDEASDASDTARAAGPDEFVTDPLRRTVPSAPAPRPEPRVEAKLEPAPVQIPAPALMPVAAVAPAPAVAHAPAPARATLVETPHGTLITVPVTVKRSELANADSLRVQLDITLED